MHLSFALSITHFFSSVGADAGFAALVGLAILVLLYFAHARETATLRSHLAAATQRIEELERRLAGGPAPATGAQQSADAPSTAPGAAPAVTPPPFATPPVTPRPVTAPPVTHSPITAQPAAAARVAAPAPAAAAPAATSPPATSPAPSGERPPAAVPAVSARPLAAPSVVAPAGMGAPALSDATRVVPVGEPAGEHSALPGDASGEGESLSAGGAAVSGATAALTGDGASSQGVPRRTPSPVTAAAGGNGFPGAPASARPGGPRPSLLEHGIPGQRQVVRWLIPAVALLLVAVIAVLLLLVLTPGSAHHKTAVVHRHHAANIAAAPSGVTPSLVTVAVVNATNVNQLAHHLSTHLTAMHFQPGALATATNQSAAKTTVGYLPGHRDDALAVAHALKLPASAVRPVTQSSEGLVCPSATSCPDDVIVVAGSDLAPKR